MTNSCPHCGRAIVIKVQKHRSAYGVPWTPMPPMADSARRPKFGDVAEAPAPEFTEAYRDTPARAPSVNSDVGVPFGKALITGILIGFPGGIISVAWWGWPWWCIFACPVGITGTIWVVFGLIKGSDTLWVREKIINKDQGKAPQQSITVEASLHREGEEEDHWDLANLPAPSWELLQEFAKDVLDENVDITFSERGAARYGYSRNMFWDLRDRFVAAGWARWRNPEYREQGAALLVGGRAILRKIASGEV